MAEVNVTAQTLRYLRTIFDASRDRGTNAVTVTVTLYELRELLLALEQPRVPSATPGTYDPVGLGAALQDARENLDIERKVSAQAFAALAECSRIALGLPEGEQRERAYKPEEHVAFVRQAFERLGLAPSFERDELRAKLTAAETRYNQLAEAAQAVVKCGREPALSTNTYSLSRAHGELAGVLAAHRDPKLAEKVTAAAVAAVARATEHLIGAPPDPSSAPSGSPIPQPGQVWRVKDGPNEGTPVVVESVHESGRHVIDDRGRHWRFDELRPEGSP